MSQQQPNNLLFGQGRTYFYLKFLDQIKSYEQSIPKKLSHESCHDRSQSSNQGQLGKLSNYLGEYIHGQGQCKKT